MFQYANYGVLDIDWAAGEVAVSIRGADGATVMREVALRDALR